MFRYTTDPQKGMVIGSPEDPRRRGVSKIIEKSTSLVSYLVPFVGPRVFCGRLPSATIFVASDCSRNAVMIEFIGAAGSASSFRPGFCPGGSQYSSESLMLRRRPDSNVLSAKFNHKRSKITFNGPKLPEKLPYTDVNGDTLKAVAALTIGQKFFLTM